MKSCLKSQKFFYQRARFCGGQVSRIYGLAEVHKKDVPLHPISSRPGSCYHNLSTTLAKVLAELPENKLDCDTKFVECFI